VAGRTLDQTLEIRTVAGPSRHVQWVLSGGPYTTASHRVQAQETCPAAACRGRRHARRGLDSGLADARWGIASAGG
jgi:hypothetical protein